MTTATLDALHRSLDQHLDAGHFLAELTRRVAMATESDTGSTPPPALGEYL